MWKNRDLYNNILLIGFVVLLFIVSYLRYTYYINPNFSGEPVWIKIAEAKQQSKGILDFNTIIYPVIDNIIMGKSIIVFWILFGIINVSLFKSWRNKKEDVMLFLLTYGGLSMIIVFFMGLHFVFRPEMVFFGLFTKIKNFLLSPLYTGVIFIFAKFFNRIVQ